MDRRERLVARLREHGAQRRSALSSADQELEAIAGLLPDALDAGITKMEISRLTGVGRPTIDAILNRRE
jgi:hypothetical protein